MASPRAAPAATGSTQPLTPPDDPSSANQASSQNGTANPNAVPSAPPVPPTSLNDSGKWRRPRDARLIHMLLASLGVTSYQERVPLQLLDFAYRYTSSTLQDAVHLAMEGYAGTATGPGETNVSTGGGRGGVVELNTITLQALRLSIASRLHYQFQPGLPKEFLIDVASERNRIALPGVARGGETGLKSTFSDVSMGGMRLPPERFCLTGTGWSLRDEWESEGEEDVEELEPTILPNNEEEDGMEDEDDGKMEDIFGEDVDMKEGDEEDENMADA
jgi:transcription initiation factor TFIID subunit 9B